MLKVTHYSPVAWLVAIAACLDCARNCANAQTGGESVPAPDAAGSVRLVREGYALPAPGTRFRDKVTVEMKNISLDVTSDKNRTKGKYSYISKDEVEYEVVTATQLRARIVERTKTTVFEMDGLPPKEIIDRSAISKEWLAGSILADERGAPVGWIFKFEDKARVATVEEHEELAAFESPFASDQTYPSAPMKIGDQWDIDLQMIYGAGTHPGNLQMKLAKAFERKAEPCALIEITGTTAIPISLASPELNATLKFQGETVRSLVNFVDITSDLTGEVEVEGKDPDYGMKIQGKGKFSSKSERIMEPVSQKTPSK